MLGASSKLSSNPSFDGVFPKEQTSPTIQNADFAVGPAAQFPRYSTSVPEGVPAASRVVISGAGVTESSPGQYAVVLSLSGTNTVQLTPGLTDAIGNTTPVIGTFFYRARNQQVGVSDSGLVTATARTNGAVVETEYPSHQVNAAFDNASPSGTEHIGCSLLVTVLS